MDRGAWQAKLKKKKKIIANAGEDVEKQPCMSCWWESKMVQPR